MFSIIALASAFDLICSGTLYVRDQIDPYTIIEPREIVSTYRINLADRRWCVDDCYATVAIATVEPTMITLQDFTTPSDGIDSYKITINRETGFLLSKMVSRGREMRTVQKCVRRPFEGFPDRKF